MLPKLTAPEILTPNCEMRPPNWSSIHPNSPPSQAMPHTVAEGQSFITLGRTYKSKLEKYRSKFPEPSLLDGLGDDMANARALIYFNYGTTVPEYVNWHLLNTTCCYHATEDKNNRRFSNHDTTYRSPAFGSIKRAGQIYIPEGVVKPPPKVVPDVRPVSMWLHLQYHDGLFSWLNDIAKARGAGSVEMMLEILEDAKRKSGVGYSTEQLRKMAKMRKFIKPLRWGLKAAKRLGWVASIAELILGGRVVKGHLVMSYDDNVGEHFSWEVNMVMKGPHVFTDESGWVTTTEDKFKIRKSVFDPEKWGKKNVLATMTGGSMAMSVLGAFRRPPHKGDASERGIVSPLVLPRPGAFDWPLAMKPHGGTLGGGFALFKTLPWLDATISNGRRRSFAEIMSH